MRTERSAERELVWQDRLDILRDRLYASEEKQGRLYGRLLDTRERIARLEEHGRRLDECLSEAREHNAGLMEENRLLRQHLAQAPEVIALPAEKHEVLLERGMPRPLASSSRRASPDGDAPLAIRALRSPAPTTRS
jgi:hypothetical protein